MNPTNTYIPTGEQFASELLNGKWDQYISSFGVAAAHNEWLSRTIAQGFDSFAQEEQLFLASHLLAAYPTVNYNQPMVDKRLHWVYDELLEPYYQQKLSVNSIKDVFHAYIVIRKQQVDDYSASLKVKEVLAEIQHSVSFEPRDSETEAELGVIDITGEGVKIDYGNSVNIYEGTNGVQHQGIQDEWQLGTLYRQKLQLTNEEVAWLNKLPDPINSFTSIEYCCAETIKLYLACIKSVNQYYAHQNKAIKIQIKNFIAEVIVSNRSFADRWYSQEQFKDDFESAIFLSFYKKAESAVRSAYRHSRKISAAFVYTEFADRYEEIFGKIADELIVRLQTAIASPDEATEKELNRLNTTRWKYFFNNIIATSETPDYSSNAEQIDQLVSLNEHNPSLEQIHYEAAKFFASRDKVRSLQFYLKYIYADLNSEKVDGKQLGKSLQKIIFETHDQIKEFQRLVDELNTSRDLTAALSKVASIYLVKRKKITLNTSEIEQVKNDHLGTVTQLNELLQEDEDVLPEAAPVLDWGYTTIAHPVLTADSSLTLAGLTMEPYQTELLQLFHDNGFIMDSEAISSYARDKGFFKNQMIERINELCYDELDDLLIEETENGYEINSFSYNKIINLC